MASIIDPIFDRFSPFFYLFILIYFVNSESLDWSQSAWNATFATSTELGLDPSLYASSRPLGDLFGVNELSADFDGALEAGLYDEMTCGTSSIRIAIPILY